MPLIPGGYLNRSNLLMKVSPSNLKMHSELMRKDLPIKLEATQ
jgi:hypothetical protein